MMVKGESTMLYLCKSCGGIMTCEDKTFLICQSCLTSVEIEDYDTEWEELFTPPKEEKPEYCDICGGPYPNCMTSCKLFDE